ncbi:MULTISPECIES: YraN family protein [unclassified Microcystis]|jgi:putative endonuclease|uniref:YraN family protein n=1 Tax=unclassified Microcystis TaxID=2643300 RepID=UPI0022C73767|nr:MULTISPECIES: YraN family protein [unclassified Microcystis]MCA2693337.1 YraN family protein [Microcystis sp. M034S2]MCA2751783.1 YraN family protein [Microcystis sp. M144S2]MCZ8201376.1 YraN family protein [Microcystis sp. LE19-55.1A]MCZ8305671.1 YraN family protein [Microcystis sp. LE19-98.1E]
MTTVGELGENLVADWLQLQQWHILQRRWRSGGGEIDLIVLSESQAILAFVEVKTRSADNWDLGGKLAINYRKQGRIYESAQIFLSFYPQWFDLTCRFDVALVSCQKSSLLALPEFSLDYPCQLQAGYQLQLQEYLVAVF